MAGIDLSSAVSMSDISSRATLHLFFRFHIASQSRPFDNPGIWYTIKPMSDSDSIPASRTHLKVVYPAGELTKQNWLQIARVYWRMARLVGGALRTQNITLAQFEILAILNASQGISQQELAGHLLVTKGNVCTVISRMEESGLINRIPDPTDGRAKQLFLTQAGRNLFGRVAPLVHGSVEDIFGNLTIRQQQDLQQLLDQLERDLMGKGLPASVLNSDADS